MYSFLVLGYVPGTSIQINFQGWLNLIGFIIAAYFLAKLLYSRGGYSMDYLTLQSRGLHAAQVHSRISPSAR